MRRLCTLLAAGSLLVTVLLSLAAAPPTPVASGAEDEKALQAAKVGIDTPALLGYLRQRTLSDTDHERIGSLVRQLRDDSFKVRYQAMTDLLAFGPPALPFLRRAQNDPDEEAKERARECVATLEKAAKPTLSAAVVRLLRLRAPAEAVGVLLAFLPDAENEALEEEVLFTLAVLGVREGKVDSAVAAALKDKQPARRGAAALILGRSGSAEQRTAAQALLADPDPWVRFRAAQGQLAGRDRSGVAVLVALLADGPLDRAGAAEDLLTCLAGPRSPRIVVADDPVIRKRCHDAWASWWRVANKMDLSRADLDLPPFNPTLCVRLVARQFMAALLRNDAEGVKKTTAVPFRFLGMQTFATRDDLDKMLDQNPLGQRGLIAFSFTLLRTGPLDEYVRVLNPDDRQFLSRVKKNEIRVVYIQFQVPGRGDAGEVMALLVRTARDQVQVIGIGQMAGGMFMGKG
jgi:HEAT repeat protein